MAPCEACLLTLGKRIHYMQMMRPLQSMKLAVGLGLLFVWSGCERANPPTQPTKPGAPAAAARPTPVNVPSTFQLSVDPERLRLPAGIGQFWRDYNSERVPPENVQAVLELARNYEKLDQHKAYYFEAIPIAKFKCAQTLSAGGEHEKALAILEEVRTKGYLPVDFFGFPGFDPIREDPRFKALKEFAEKETDADSVGPYLVAQTPFFKVDELLTVPTNPPLPAAESLQNGVTVILTGPALSGGMGGNDIGLLNNLTGAGAKILAIVGQAPAETIPEVQVHIASVEPQSLLVDRTRMCWIADKRGQVVYNLRLDAYYNKHEPKLVIEYLKNH